MPEIRGRAPDFVGFIGPIGPIGPMEPSKGILYSEERFLSP